MQVTPPHPTPGPIFDSRPPCPHGSTVTYKFANNPGPNDTAMVYNICYIAYSGVKILTTLDFGVPRSFLDSMLSYEAIAQICEIKLKIQCEAFFRANISIAPINN